MALVLKRIYTGYFWLFNDLSDPRANDYLLLRTPLVPFGIMTSYLYFVFTMGPKLMQNRKPVQMKTFLLVYNFSQILFNVFLIILVCQALRHMNLDCNLIDYTQSPKGKRSVRIVYYYYLLKLYDLIDTILIILKKNKRQITFLHVYHHCGMVAGSFIAAKFLPGGELIWSGFMNLIVHSVMYLYYLTATLDSKWKNYLTIKKFLTQLQLVQFVANIVIYGRLLFIDCTFPRIVSYLYVPQNIFMLALFGDFYINTYIFNKSKRNNVNKK